MASNTKNRAVQRTRMITYFVNAAEQIMEESGLQGLTARNVADLAGYNVATLYNYFENLNHLVLFTSIKYLGAYAEDLKKRMQQMKDPLECYWTAWDCFCTHSFTHPQKFHSMFYGEFSPETLKSSIQLYFEIYPDALNDMDSEYIPIMMDSDLNVRNMPLLRTLFKDKDGVTEEKMQKASDMSLLIYQSLLYRFMMGTSQYSVEEGGAVFIEFSKKTFEIYGLM